MNPLDWLKSLVGREAPGFPTGMDRRRFLTILGGTAAGVALAPMLDVDKLLWMPDSSIVVAGETGLFLTPGWIVTEGLAMLKNNLSIVGLMNRQYDDKWAASGKVVGETVNVRSPFGLTAMTLTDQFGVDFDMDRYPVTKRWTKREARKRLLEPAVASIAGRMKDVGMTVCAPLECPRGNFGDHFEAAVATDPMNGLSVRAFHGVMYDVQTGMVIDKLRIDVLGGRA